MSRHPDATFRRLKSHVHDVAIVGCGPTGACLANLLGRAGLSVLVVERQAGIDRVPRSMHIDGEAMRGLQAAGLAERLLSVMRPGHGMQWVDGQGETLLLHKGWDGLGLHGWHSDYYFNQPEVEAMLRAGFDRYPDITFFEGVDAACLAGPTETGEHVALSLCNRDSGATATATCRYVVGCDGEDSVVRRSIDDRLEDLGLHQGWLIVEALLDRPLPLPRHTVQHLDPARPATCLCVDPLRYRWEIMLLPTDDPETITQPEVVWPLLERWLMPTQATLERASTRVFHALLAHRWQRGRLMIAGDAAHQLPPFLGQSLSSGIRDAVNLAWKLAFAVRHPDQAAALLATYGTERRAHVRAFIERSVQLGRLVQVTDPQEAALRDAHLRAEPLPYDLPTPRLGPGVHQGGGTAAGQVFPQPMLPSGCYLDDVVGYRFCLLLDDTASDWLDRGLRTRLDDMNITVLTDAGGAVDGWLRLRQVSAVLLRPDGYVFASCASAEALRRAVDDLGRWIGALPVTIALAA